MGCSRECLALGPRDWERRRWQVMWWGTCDSHTSSLHPNARLFPRVFSHSIPMTSLWSRHFPLSPVYIWGHLGSKKIWLIECHTADKWQCIKHRPSDFNGSGVRPLWGFLQATHHGSFLYWAEGGERKGKWHSQTSCGHFCPQLSPWSVDIYGQVLKRFFSIWEGSVNSWWAALTDHMWLRLLIRNINLS